MLYQKFITIALIAVLTAGASASSAADSWSGIYPHLAMFNNESECGTGVVVPWAGRLWVVTYAPHQPRGSSDKLYEIDETLHRTIRPESIGGTPANRMIHRESNQLFIGPYVIDAERRVRTIPYATMFGRPTGTARHLTDPRGKVYSATMEEGLYEVDVQTLAVTELWRDEQLKGGRHSDLPGYHGKGLYSGQGRIVYANNGEHGAEAQRNPVVAAGVLAEWDGKAANWTVVRRNQFTEVSGPGGIEGNSHPDTDPIWSIGWDHRSLILMVLDKGQWHSFRLPKASHAYDGAHGWNTEWPRIRDIGEQDLLMTMHGMFWRFPKDFRPDNSAGIAPRSSYLKVIGDFARWNDHVVLGCDDAAKAEFLNKRSVKGSIQGPARSQSNLVFLTPEQLDQFGPVMGRGSLWLRDAVEAGVASEPFLFSGFAHRQLAIQHDSAQSTKISLEISSGDGTWSHLRDVTVPAGETVWHAFDRQDSGVWIRLTAAHDLAHATAVFEFAGEDARSTEAAPLFDGVAAADAREYLAGVVRPYDGTLGLAAMTVTNDAVTSNGFYELDVDMKLRRQDRPGQPAQLLKDVAIPRNVITIDSASVLVVDDAGRRWRLPKNDASFDSEGAVPMRISREVVTERDLFQAHGSFYELPAENADGFRKIRPVTTHNRRIVDYTSFRGLMVMTGIAPDGATDNRHIIRSEDGKAAVWVGSIDDLWQLGKPVGRGGPWKDSNVVAGEPSDAYLMSAYDKKSLRLSHRSDKTVTMRVEVDISCDGEWATYQTFDVPAGEVVHYEFPGSFRASWVRVVADSDTSATATFAYE